jgi:hypothetical protein
MTTRRIFITRSANDHMLGRRFWHDTERCHYVATDLIPICLESGQPTGFVGVWGVCPSKEARRYPCSPQSNDQCEQGSLPIRCTPSATPERRQRSPAIPPLIGLNVKSIWTVSNVRVRPVRLDDGADRWMFGQTPGGAGGDGAMVLCVQEIWSKRTNRALSR